MKCFSPVFALAAFAATMSLVACDASSSASNDESPISIGDNNDKNALSTDKVDSLGSESESSCKGEFSEIGGCLPECNAENEGNFEWTCSNYWRGSCVGQVYYKCEKGNWVETEYNPPLPEKECTAEKEGAVDSVAEPHYDQSKKQNVENYYYMCNKNKWNLINETLAKCTTAETKVGDECCDVIYGVLTVVFPSSSKLYKYTEEGWINQGVYSDTECKDFSYDPADSCSVPAEACTESDNNKIDSTLKSAKTSSTCYSVCLNKKWMRLSAEDAAVYAYCGEPDEEKGIWCCYTYPTEITEKYPRSVSANYVYDTYFGWGVKEYFDTPNCSYTAE